jgi:hypothetical protein
MATNEILRFAETDTGTNLLTQSEYAADSQRPIGNQPGVARSKLVNKALRQASLIAAGVAEFLADNQANNITDGLTPQNIADYMAAVVRSLGIPTAVAGGTADAITADFTPNVSLTNGTTVIVRAGSANATTTSTFAPDGLTAKTIVKGNNRALVAGDIAGAGHWLEMNFDSVLDKWVLQNPAYGVLTASTPAIKAQSPLGIGASTTLVSTHVGRPLYYSGAAAGTLTLPASPLAGDAITVYAVGAGDCTIQRNGSQTIYAQGRSAVTNIVLNTGASATLIYDGAAWVQAAGNNSIGYGQSWQNLNASRAFGTTYYNTTGKPIQVVVTAAAITAASWDVKLVVNGVTLPQGGATSSNSAWVQISAIIPPGASYLVSSTNATLQPTTGWSELR